MGMEVSARRNDRPEKQETEETYLAILSDADILERRATMELDFIDQNADAASVSGDLADRTAEARTLFL